MNASSRRAEGVLRNHRLLSRIKNSNPEHFVNLVHAHFAAHLGDLPENTSVAELLGDSLLSAQKSNTPPHFSQSRKFTFSKKNVPKGSGGVFGVPLTEEIVKRIYPLIRCLNTTDCQKRVGLFRKSGSAAKQKELCEMLNIGSDIEAQLDASLFSPHDVACVLKLFLRLLPEPLLTERHIKAYYLVAGMVSASDRTEMLQLMMLLLPPENATLLRHLLDLLQRTSEEKDNLMDRNALAIVIAPNLFALRNLTASQIQIMTTASISIVTFMIEKANIIFNVPEKLMQDVKNYLEGASAIDSKSDSDGVATNHERENMLTTQMHARIDSLDSIQTVSSSHSSGFDALVRGRQRTGDDLLLPRPFNPSTPAKRTTQKKRTRSLGNTLRNIFQRCKSVVYGSPPQVPLPTHPIDSYISTMDDNLRISAGDSDESDLCFLQHGNNESGEPPSEMPPPSLSRVNIVDVGSSRASRQLFPSSSSSDDLPPTSPDSSNASTSQTTVSPVSATSGQLTPSASKYRQRKIHPLYHWRAKGGLGRASEKGQRPRPMTSLASRDGDSKESIFFEPQFDVANADADGSVFCISLDDFKDASCEQMEPVIAESSCD